MIEVERVRSQFIVTESVNIQKHLEALVQKLKNIADRMPTHSDVNEDMEDIVTGMSTALRSIGGFAKVAKSPAREVNEVLTSVARTKARDEISERISASASAERSITRTTVATPKGTLVVQQKPSLRALADPPADNEIRKETLSVRPVRPLAFDFGCQTDSIEDPPHPIHTPSLEVLDGTGMDESKSDHSPASMPSSPRAEGKELKGKDKKRPSKMAGQLARQGSEAKMMRAPSMRDKRSR
jgi:hypothetical protein